MFEDVNKGEWRFLGIIWIIVSIIVFLPIILGFFMTPPGSVFLFKSRLNGDDCMVYFSQIDQVKHGMVFLKDFFTQESQSTGVLSPFWILVGSIAGIFSLLNFVAFHLATFILIPLFLISAYCLISYFFKEKIKRKICFVFLVFASGIGGLLFFIPGKDLQFPSTNIPEAFSISTLSSPPHFIASATLLILVFLFSLYAFEKYKLAYSLLAGFFAFLLFSFHPYHIYTVFSVLLVFLIVEFFIDRKIYFNQIVHYIILLIFSAPPVIYYLWAFKNVPAYYQTLFLQNITLSPSLWVVLFDYSAFLILAVVGLAYFLKKKSIDKKEIFLIVWAVSQFLLIYFPVNTQRRLFEGLDIPIIILATYGWIFVKDNWFKKKPEIFRQFFYIFSFFLFICIFFMTNVISISFDYILLKYYPSYSYMKADDKSAMLWIKDNTPEKSIIFSGVSDGELIPVFSFRQVYYGHWSETINAEEKLKILEDFFSKYGIQEKKEFLDKNHINYLFWGAEEKKAAGDFDPNQENFLQKVYGNKTASVYKVN